MKKNIIKIIIIFAFGVLLLWLNYTYISYSSKDEVFDDSNEISKIGYALLLGTPKYLLDGTVNNYYKNRIKAVVDLYNKDIINEIIVSADSLNKYKENEVELMKYDLLQNGIPASNLVFDTDGNRTWKSIVNLKNNNAIKSVVIISQKFHLERALYIAKQQNIHAIGYVAKGQMSNKLRIREILARVKMQIDVLQN